MACLWPRIGWRSPQGEFSWKVPTGRSGLRYQQLTVPCGGCIQCRVRNARDWAIRCTLELREHDSAAWATLTYDDEHLVRPLPELQPTLSKPHLQGYLKRLRERVRSHASVRFFGVGEYGGRTHRPHYHVILYGLDRDNRAIEKAWPHGHVRVEPVTLRNIAYTAGYANKKLRAGLRRAAEYVDQETGEVFEWQEPFRLCSRRPGIGGAARRFAHSWRTSAIHQGTAVPVPRYLHNAWRELASDEQLAKLEAERRGLRSLMAEALARNTKESWEEYYRDRDAREANAEARHKLSTEIRTL